MSVVGSVEASKVTIFDRDNRDVDGKSPRPVIGNCLPRSHGTTESVWLHNSNASLQHQHHQEEREGLSRPHRMMVPPSSSFASQDLV